MSGQFSIVWFEKELLKTATNSSGNRIRSDPILFGFGLFVLQSPNIFAGYEKPILECQYQPGPTRDGVGRKDINNFPERACKNEIIWWMAYVGVGRNRME